MLNKESNQVVKLSKNLKIVSKPDGAINSEIITQKDASILEIFIELDDEEIEDQEETEIEDDSDSDSSIPKELKIKVSNPLGEEKTIIIKYNE